MSAQPLYFKSIGETSRLISSRQISPVELTREYLNRIARFDDELHSFVLIVGEAALDQAKRLQVEIMKGHNRGPLHGIPYGLKDVYATAGIRTTAGSNAFKDNIPCEDATVVQKLATAGCILLGKLATHELTYGGVSDELPWPPTRNPWNLEYDSGGSSSGSGAAVAAGLCAMALGTDTGGSIRNPAGMCGIVGLRPTYGRVSRHGVVRNSHSFDVCGPLARSVDDCARILSVIAGADPQDSSSSDKPVDPWVEMSDSNIRGMRIGVVRHFYERDLALDEDVLATMEESCNVFRSLGATLVEVTLPPLATYAECKISIQGPEIYAAHRKLLEAQPQLFGRKLLERILPGRSTLAVDYVDAQDMRRALTSQTISAMAEVDVLVTCGPGPAPKLSDVIAMRQLNFPEIAVPFSVTGQPAICVCNGFNKRGLPLSLQIAGRHFCERTVLRVAHAYEQATQWHDRHPDMSVGHA